MKNSKVVAVLMMLVVFALFTPNSAGAKGLQEEGFTVASVDVNQVVQKSSQISALNADRQAKLNDLENFVLNARKDVAAQKTDADKKALEDKYNKELNLRKDAIDKDYATKLEKIDKDITSMIKKKSRELGYDLVLTKASILDGAVDITPEIIKGLK